MSRTGHKTGPNCRAGRATDGVVDAHNAVAVWQEPWPRAAGSLSYGSGETCEHFARSIERAEGESQPGREQPGNAARDPALDLLRPLARRAIGMSGADIERLVREARGRARRAGRALSWQDIDDLVLAGRPAISDDLRWRLAVHECGHVLVHLALGLGCNVEIITVESHEGGFVRLAGHDDSILSERGAMENLAVMLAGRRAEITFFGDALSASGGAPESDLGRATELAIALETSLGFGRKHALIFRPVSDPATQLAYDRELAGRVDARLQEADTIATTIIEDHAIALTLLAREVARHRTLEGDHLREVIGHLRQRLQNRRE